MAITNHDIEQLKLWKGPNYILGAANFIFFGNNSIKFCQFQNCPNL